MFILERCKQKKIIQMLKETFEYHLFLYDLFWHQQLELKVELGIVKGFKRNEKKSKQFSLLNKKHLTKHFSFELSQYIKV